MTTAIPPVETRSRELVGFFALTYGITWGLAVLLLALPGPMARLFGPMSMSSPLYYLAVYAPSLSALALTACRSGTSGVLGLLGTLRPRRASIPYYALVLLGWPVVYTVALLLQRAVTGESPPMLDSSRWYWAPVVLATALIVDAGPLGEELGWRGYALPRMLASTRARSAHQAGSSPLTVALVLGVIWGIWHLPAFFVAGTAQHDRGMGFLWLLVGITLSSVIMTWIYRRTGGDVLAAGVLVHLMNNQSQADLVYVDVVYAVVAAAAAVSLVRDREPKSDVLASPPLPHREAHGEARGKPST